MQTPIGLSANAIEKDRALLRVGIVGLGSIAQKAYLPILSQAVRWQLVGAYSPGKEKALRLCLQYRIHHFSDINALAAQCDAVFVHSSTETHFSVVSALLQAGVHVYVDKPLAETIEQAEILIALAEQRQKNLMVGFNRRFAPLYQRLKHQVTHLASLRMDKHRMASIGPQPMRFTLLDDYLHVIDTALWLAGEVTQLKGGILQCNAQGQLQYAEHHFQSANSSLITTSMHRHAGSQCERIYAITDGAQYQVDEMREWRQEQQGGITCTPVASWQTTLEQRGFVGAVNHFIDSIEQQKPAETSGKQALRAQYIIEELLGKS
ncbi:Gfo/Idh/MocA family protein [Pectobacterium sp. B1J-3]|uniref:Gfo/Idh/MocA family protein n=1 Tax=Pectobacterium sp. B1J-3 TaxID=3385371 RepID=UPI0039061CA8